MANKAQLRAYAKKMRANPTKSEKEARIALKRSRIPFKEQVPFKYYILDFLISNRLLVLEIDGGYHKARSWKDKRRDDFCREIGLKVLRIKNKDVKSVVSRVKKFAKVKNYKAKLKIIMNKIK
jgi:very-short-patch-repair endonuclease